MLDFKKKKKRGIFWFNFKLGHRNGSFLTISSSAQLHPKMNQKVVEVCRRWPLKKNPTPRNHVLFGGHNKCITSKVSHQSVKNVSAH